MPGPFYAEGSETSKQAAETLTVRQTHARQIVELGVRKGLYGFTADEAAEALDIHNGRCSPRVTELGPDNAKVLEATGRTRMTRYGRPAEVYVLAEGLTATEAMARYHRWVKASPSTTQRTRIFEAAEAYGKAYRAGEPTYDLGNRVLEIARGLGGS